MIDMTTINSVNGRLSETTSRDSQDSFQQHLFEEFSLVLGGSASSQLESLIRQLPVIIKLTEQESLELYVDSLRTLLEKQAAFTGSAKVETIAHWMQSLHDQAINGLVVPQDLMAEVNNTLVHQFQSWFDKQLKHAVDNSLPTGFINDFRLGSQETQAQQIANANVDTLKVTAKKISAFVDSLAVQMRTNEARNNSNSFLRNAFHNLGSVDIYQLINSDYLLTQERFKAAVSTQLIASLKNVGITISSDDALALANKISWIPGMSKQELNGVLDELAKQIKGQFENVYSSSGNEQLSKLFAIEVSRIKMSSDTLELSSLFSNIAVALVNTQINSFYKELQDVQVTQITSEQVNVIKQNTARDIELIFKKIISGQDFDTDFVSRHKKMTRNLTLLKVRLDKITDEEKNNKQVRAEHALTAHDLLSVIDSSIGDRFDERVLFALNERRVNRLEKRNDQKENLENLTIQLKFFGVVQSKIHATQSLDGSYLPMREIFVAADFNYSSESDFKASPEYKYLKDNNITSHHNFLKKQGIDALFLYKDDEKSKSLSSFSSAISDKSKLLNDEVQIKTTELNDTSSQYNSTVEAMNKFVQKYNSILQEILRAI
ncbi:TPA: virulence-associated V antigen [Vibrio harveyi]